MKTLRLTALLPVALFVACGGSSDFTEGDGGGDSVALEALPGEFAAAQCAAFERCFAAYYDVIFSLEDCATVLESQLREGGFGEIEQAVEDGRVAYDGKSARKCTEAIRNVDCAAANERPIDVCENALEGSIEAGGDCSIDDECEAGLICDTNQACPGTCASRLIAGDPCRANDECASGLVCSGATSRCVEPGGLGEACGGGIEPQCDGGLACIGDSVEEMRTGECRPSDEIELVGLDEACDPSQGILCEQGLSCVVESLTPSFVCKDIPPSGGACGIGFPEDCLSGEYCAISGAELVLGIFEGECLPLPQIGEDCAERPLDGFPACEAYARCDLSTGTCLGIRGLGESCSSNELCYSGNCENGGCAPLRACQ